MSTIKKLNGKLSAGPCRHTANFEVYSFIRVGDDYLPYTKIPGHLNTLLREGMNVEAWAVPLKIPMPFLYSSKAWVIYAARIDGRLYNFADETTKEWSKAKFWLGSGLTVATIVTIFFPPLSLLLLINAIRLTFTSLPIFEMRREPAKG
jgi:hypothetical protein